MKISEISISDVASYLRLEEGCYRTSEIQQIMTTAERYISAYTGIPPAADAPDGKNMDDYEDFYIAYMILCQDMYDNRSYIVDNGNVNRVVESVLNMHTRNLI